MTARNSERNWYKALFGINLLTLATHFYLTLHYYQLKFGTAEGPAICNINSLFSCDSVATSRFAEIVGIPVALLGFVAQIITSIFLISLFFQLSSSLQKLKKIFFFFSLFIAIVSVVMGSISIALIGSYCIFCIAAYLLSFVQALLAFKIQTPSHPTDVSNYPRWALGAILLAPAIAWMLHSITLSQNGYQKINQIVLDSIAEWQANPINAFSLDKGLIIGADPKNAKVVIVEFADFLCPHCKMASPALETFINTQKGTSLILKFFPLDGSCNSQLKQSANGIRCKLAASALCAEKLSKLGWKTHHWIFERQEALARISDFSATAGELASFIQVNPENFNQCLNSDETQDEIQNMTKEAGLAKIQGTPAIFVNGKELPRAQMPPVINALYQQLSSGSLAK